MEKQYSTTGSFSDVENENLKKELLDKADEIDSMMKEVSKMLDKHLEKILKCD